MFLKPSDCLKAAVRGALLRGYSLKPRQLEVLELLAEGMDTEGIVARLVISPRTVEDHIGELYQALGTDHERSVLVAHWLQLVYEAVDALGLFLPVRWPEQVLNSAQSTGKDQ